MKHYTLLLLTLLVQWGWSHCQVPCGIYNDPQRIEILAEHITTIEKAIGEINRLTAAPEASQQLTRWVVTKEEHATKIQRVVSDYFLAQRIKPSAKNYEEKLTTLHSLLLLSMQSKQKSDEAIVKEMRSVLARCEELYIGHSHHKK